MENFLKNKLVMLGLLFGCIVSGIALRVEVSHAMNKMPNYLKSFKATDPAPVCGSWREYMPKQRDASAYRVYIQARKRWRSKRAWEFKREELLSILVDITSAADKGDWGAKALLAHFYLYGLGPLSSNNVLLENKEKAVEIERQAIANGQPWGFFDLGVAHEYGYGGAARDNEIAWAYYLKAARMGSPDAQMALAKAYRGVGNEDAELAMFKCAYAQGHGPAAHALALDAAIAGRITDAMRLYQDGIKFGSKESAATMYLAFAERQGPDEKVFLSELHVEADPVRSRRYEEIMDALEINPDLKFGRLDEVLPLPPAMLPAWHGIEAALTPEPEGPPTY